MTTMQPGYELQMKHKVRARLDILGSMMWVLQVSNLVRLVGIIKNS